MDSLTAPLSCHTWNPELLGEADHAHASPVTFTNETLVPLVQHFHERALAMMATTPPGAWQLENEKICDEPIYGLAIPLDIPLPPPLMHAAMLLLNACANPGDYGTRYLSQHKPDNTGKSGHPLLFTDTPINASFGAYFSIDEESGKPQLHLLCKNPTEFYKDKAPQEATLRHHFQRALDRWLLALQEAIDHPKQWTEACETNQRFTERSTAAKTYGKALKQCRPYLTLKPIAAESRDPGAIPEGGWDKQRATLLVHADISDQIHALEQGASPLELAIMRHDMKAVKGHLREAPNRTLVASNAGVMNIACRYGTPAIIATLLSYIPPHAPVKQSSHIAYLAERNLLETAKALVDRGWAIEEKDFSFLCRSCDDATLRSLLQIIDCVPFQHSATPLCEAAAKNRVKTLDAMLDHGWDINAPDTSAAQQPALMHALHNGEWEATKLLLDRGASLALCTGFDGNHGCAIMLHNKQYELFPNTPGAADPITYGVTVRDTALMQEPKENYRDQRKEAHITLNPLSHILLHWEDSEPHHTLIDTLLRNMQDPKLLNPAPQPELKDCVLPPLHALLYYQLKHDQTGEKTGDTLRQLLKAGADPNLPYNGVTPIHLAAMASNMREMLDLIDYGAELKRLAFTDVGYGTYRDEGKSAIERLAGYSGSNKYDCQKWLLNYFSKDREGRNALRTEWKLPPSDTAPPSPEMEANSAVKTTKRRAKA